MNNEFEKPTQAPVKADRPWTRRITYKSGKTPAGFAAKATPADVSAGFSYYDTQAAQKVEVPEFVAFIVATLSGVSGTVPDGQKYVNYFSSLVYDTRTDPIRVFMQGAERPIAQGIYKQLDLPAGVNYTQHLICYIPADDETVSIELTAGLQNAVKRAIGEACNVRPGKVSLFNLCDLSTEFWGIRFSGEFDKRDKEGNEWKTGEMYFMPKLSAGVVTMTKNPELVGILNEKADAVRTYCNGYADELRSAEPVAQPTQTATPAPTTARPPSNATQVPFPTTEPAGVADDLPF